MSNPINRFENLNESKVIDSAWTRLGRGVVALGQLGLLAISAGATITGDVPLPWGTVHTDDTMLRFGLGATTILQGSDAVRSIHSVFKKA